MSVAVARLSDPHEAAAQIDYVLQECVIRSRPVYITLPTDMVQKKVEGERLKTPIDTRIPKNNPDVEDYVVGVILNYLHAAKNPTMTKVDSRIFITPNVAVTCRSERNEPRTGQLHG